MQVKSRKIPYARPAFGPRLMDPEWKTSLQAITSTPGANTPTFFNVTAAIAQGVGYNQRVGDGVTVKLIDLAVRISTPATPGAYFLVQPVLTVEAGQPASDMLLGTGPLNSVDRHTVQPVSPPWRMGIQQAAEGATSAVNAIHTWDLRGNWPIRWDRTGDPAGPQLGILFTGSAVDLIFEIVATVTYTDA